MNTGGEAADQVIRMSLNGVEVAAKISGKAAVEVAQMLYAVMKDQKKTKGKTSLVNLIKTGKPLSVFSVKSEDFSSFQKEAKKYGILYYAVKNKNDIGDGMVDLMVKTEDAPRFNRIVDRFQFSDVSQSATVKADIEKSRESKKQKEEISKGYQPKDRETVKKEADIKNPQNKGKDNLNPDLAKTTKSRQSEPIFKPFVEGQTEKSKPSVRQELNKIRTEQEKRAKEVSKEKGAVKDGVTKTAGHKQPRRKKKKVKER